MEKAQKEYEDFVKAVLDWKEIKDEYSKGNVGIDIELNLAQNFMTLHSTFILLWKLINILIFPILIDVSCTISYEILFGIIIRIILILIDFFILSKASNDLTNIFYDLTISSAIVFMIFVTISFASSLPFILSLLVGWSNYFYLYYIAKSIVKDYALKNFDHFIFLLSNRVIRVIDKKGNVIL